VDLVVTHSLTEPKVFDVRNIGEWFFAASIFSLSGYTKFMTLLKMGFAPVESEDYKPVVGALGSTGPPFSKGIISISSILPYLDPKFDRRDFSLSVFSIYL
jgi:hypothetical protein